MNFGGNQVPPYGTIGGDPGGGSGTGDGGGDGGGGNPIGVTDLQTAFDTSAALPESTNITGFLTLTTSTAVPTAFAVSNSNQELVHISPSLFPITRINTRTLPAADDEHDFGQPNKRWKTGHFTRAYANEVYTPNLQITDNQGVVAYTIAHDALPSITSFEPDDPEGTTIIGGGVVGVPALSLFDAEEYGAISGTSGAVPTFTIAADAPDSTLTIRSTDELHLEADYIYTTTLRPKEAVSSVGAVDTHYPSGYFELLASETDLHIHGKSSVEIQSLNGAVQLLAGTNVYSDTILPNGGTQSIGSSSSPFVSGHFLNIDEHQFSSGITEGGFLSINGTTPTTFDVTMGKAFIVAPDTVDPIHILFPAEVGVSIPNPIPLVDPDASGTSLISTRILTYVLINQNGQLRFLAERPTPSVRRSFIPLGVLVHSGSFSGDNTIVAVNQNQPCIANGTNQLHDLCIAIGFINLTGNDLALGTGGGNKILKTFGTMFAVNANSNANHADPHTVTLATIDTGSGGIFQYRNRDGSSSVLTLTDFLPNLYDNGSPYNGTTPTLPNNRWTATRVFSFTSNALKLQLPQFHYVSAAEAIAGINTEAYIVEPSMAANGLLIGYIIARQGTTLALAPAQFIKASKFGGGGGGGAATTGDIASRLAIDGSNTMTGTLNTLDVVTEGTHEVTSPSLFAFRVNRNTSTNILSVGSVSDTEKIVLVKGVVGIAEDSVNAFRITNANNTQDFLNVNTLTNEVIIQSNLEVVGKLNGSLAGDLFYADPSGNLARLTKPATVGKHLLGMDVQSGGVFTLGWSPVISGEISWDARIANGGLGQRGEINLIANTWTQLNYDEGGAAVVNSSPSGYFSIANLQNLGGAGIDHMGFEYINGPSFRALVRFSVVIEQLTNAILAVGLFRNVGVGSPTLIETTITPGISLGNDSVSYNMSAIVDMSVGTIIRPRIRSDVNTGGPSYTEAFSVTITRIS